MALKLKTVLGQINNIAHVLNENFQRIKDKVLLRDGSTPMEGDLDLGGHRILNSKGLIFTYNDLKEIIDHMVILNFKEIDLVEAYGTEEDEVITTENDEYLVLELSDSARYSRKIYPAPFATERGKILITEEGKYLVMED